jgi:hypothetical protein
MLIDTRRMFTRSSGQSVRFCTASTKSPVGRQYVCRVDNVRIREPHCEHRNNWPWIFDLAESRHRNVDVGSASESNTFEVPLSGIGSAGPGKHRVLRRKLPALLWR